MARKSKKNQQKKAPKKAAPKKAAAKQQKKQRSRGGNGAGGMTITSLNEGVGFSVKPFHQKDNVIEGCDYLHTLTIDPNTPATTTSAILFQVPINPLTMQPLSRLAQMASLYDKWRLVSVSFHYATSVSAMTDGQLMMAWDADPDDNYNSVSGDALLQYLNSTSNNCTFSAYRNAMMGVPSSGPLWVQPEIGDSQRLVNHGRLWVASSGPIAAGTYGKILMKWKIKFSKPNLDPDNTTASYAASIQAPNGTYVSATYPWGNFTSIMANTTGNVSSTYNADIVEFTSLIPNTATPASVLVFKRAGKYRVTLWRIGSAIGTAAYTPTGTVGATTGGAGITAAGYPFSPDGLVAVANGASTEVIGYFDVNATGGSWIWATGDSGPTHSSCLLTVQSFPATDVNPPPAMVSYEALEIQTLKRKFDELAMAISGSTKKPPTPLHTGNTNMTTATTYSTVQSPAGEPVRNWVSSSTTTGSIGPVDVFEVTPPPPGEMRRALNPRICAYPVLKASGRALDYEQFNEDRAMFFLQRYEYSKDDLDGALCDMTAKCDDTDLAMTDDCEFVQQLVFNVFHYPDDDWKPPAKPYTKEVKQQWLQTGKGLYTAMRPMIPNSTIRLNNKLMSRDRSWRLKAITGIGKEIEAGMNERARLGGAIYNSSTSNSHYPLSTNGDVPAGMLAGIIKGSG